MPINTRLIPLDLQEVIRQLVNSPNMERDLLYYLAKKNPPYPVYVQNGTEKLTLSLAKNSYQFKLEFVLTDKKITVIKKILLNNKIQENLCVLSKHLFFSLDSGQLIELKPGPTWEIWQKIAHYHDKKQAAAQPKIAITTFEKLTKTVALSYDELNNLQLSCAAGDEKRLCNELIITLKTTRAGLTKITPQFLGKATHLPKAEKAHLNFYLDINGRNFAPTYSLFKYFLVGSHFPGKIYIKYGKKYLAKLIITTLFKISGTNDNLQASKIIKEAIETSTLAKAEFAEKAAFMLYCKAFFTEMQQVICRLFFEPQKPYFAVITLKTELEFLKTCYDFFGVEIFEQGRSFAEFVLPQANFHGQLYAFTNALAKHDFKLYYQNQLLEPVEANLQLNFSKGKTSSYFKVEPRLTFGNTEKSIEFTEFTTKNNLTTLGIFQGKIFAPPILAQLQSAKNYLPENPEQVPRMAIFNWIFLKNMGITINLEQSEQIILDKLQCFKFNKQTQPKLFNGQMRPYQVSGYAWLDFLYQHNFGAVLADDMGLGKTIQAIAFLGAIWEKQRKQKTAKPFLIVAPPSLIFNWQAEIAHFCPALTVIEYKGDQAIFDLKNWQIMLTSYEMVRRNIDQLAEIDFEVIIFDEAQLLKNLRAERHKAASQLNGKFKICLTGTPLENHLGEYYAIINLALPGLLGNYEQFLEKLKNDQLDWLLQITKPFVLRRTKQTILPDLPPKVETEKRLEMAKDQEKIYRNYLEKAKEEINAAYAEHLPQQAQIIALTTLLRLRQICIAPCLADKTWPSTSPKLDFLVEKLVELVEENHSALIFSQFTSVLDLLAPRLVQAGIEFIRLDGKTPMPKRKTLVETFQNSTKPLMFMLSLKSGGVGLNLTKASYIFHLDPWWNPATENQATDRAHRIGQKQSVFVTKLLMHNSVEEKISQLKAQKQALYQAVLNEDLAKRKNGVLLTKEDFNFLLE